MTDEQFAVVKSIDASLKQLVKAQTKTEPKTVADDKALDGQYGDPTVRYMPRFWTGDDFKGKRYSECPPALLDMVAEHLDWAAGQSDAKDEKTDKGKPVAFYKRGDAARARGWAKRKRDGWVAAKAPLFEAAATGWADQPAEKLADWGTPVDDITF